MKKCRRCGESKPLEQFYRKKDTRDGLQTHCKACDKIQVATYLAANPDKHRVYSKSTYDKQDSEKRNAKAAKWRDKNRERYREIQRDSKAKERRENREVYYARKKAWNDANREKYLNSLRRAVSKWMKENRTKMNAAHAKRRAKKIQATPAWINHEKVAEFYFAADFLGMVTGEWHHVDHIVPLQSEVVCGLHWEGNLQVLSATENLKKSNRHFV